MIFFTHRAHALGAGPLFLWEKKELDSWGRGTEKEAPGNLGGPKIFG